MPDTLSQVLSIPGLGWLLFAAFLSGTVRGFSGFGTAMVFLPIAAQAVEPVWAILALIGMDILGPIPILPRAAREARWPDLAKLLGFGLLSLPIGLWLLTRISAETYQFVVCLIALVLVGCLVAGLRYTHRPSTALLAGTGAVAGVSGGLAGVPGPPVILLYVASSLPVEQVRATTFIFLFCFDFLLLFGLWFGGTAVLGGFVLGLLLALPNALGNLAGQAIFDPDKASLYRGVAYAIVAASAVLGLPIWG